MAARAPLDVDLEDKLVYGLTPTRLAYMAIALVLGLALWSSHWAPMLVRGGACATVVVAGSIAAWGRWRGRPADRWVVDVFLFLANNYCVQVTIRWPRWAALPRVAHSPVDAMDESEPDQLSLAA